MGRKLLNDFMQKLEYSLGEREKLDLNLLKNFIYGCVSVEKTPVEVDKTGIDYIATLRGGAKINIDAKTRERGASRYWRNGEPELALEVWSVVENKTPGWTFKENSDVDYILYTFDESDCNRFFFLPYQLLRISFIKHYDEWTNKYKVKYQENAGYTSAAAFVPASVVLDAITEQMKGA